MSVGTYLRELRARRGTSIEELGRVTRVASRYLEALEADAHESLPAPVFTRGFIRAYCQAVGQPPDEALALYDAREVGPPPRVTLGAPPAPRETEKAIRSRSAVLVSLALVLVLGGALFAVALVIQPRDRGERMAATSQRSVEIRAPGGRAERLPSRRPSCRRRPRWRHHRLPSWRRHQQFRRFAAAEPGSGSGGDGGPAPGRPGRFSTGRAAPGRAAGGYLGPGTDRSGGDPAEPRRAGGCELSVSPRRAHHRGDVDSRADR